MQQTNFGVVAMAFNVLRGT